MNKTREAIENLDKVTIKRTKFVAPKTMKEKFIPVFPLEVTSNTCHPMIKYAKKVMKSPGDYLWEPYNESNYRKNVNAYAKRTYGTRENIIRKIAIDIVETFWDIVLVDLIMNHNTMYYNSFNIRVARLFKTKDKFGRPEYSFIIVFAKNKNIHYSISVPKKYKRMLENQIKQGHVYN